MIVTLISIINTLSKWKDWSSVRSGSFSPGIGGFLSVNGRLSGGLGVRVSGCNTIVHVWVWVIVSLVSIINTLNKWLASSLVKSIWVDWSSAWGRSFSPGICGFLGVDGSLSGGLGGWVSGCDTIVHVWVWVIVSLVSIVNTLNKWVASSLV